MATIGEVRQQLSHCIMRGGEGWQSMQQARELIGAAIEAFNDSFRTCASVADGSYADGVEHGMRRYSEAEAEVRAMMQKCEDAQDAALAANESIELYMSML